MSISNSLRKAAVIQERIEGLRGQLIDLLAKARADISAEPDPDVPSTLKRVGRKSGPKARGRKPAEAAVAEEAPVTKTRGRRRGSPLAGRKRVSSPSGPLAPAVVKVLQSSKKPMNVRDILDGLTHAGYAYHAPEPKKNLAARIYRLKGVKQVGPGLFAAI